LPNDTITYRYDELGRAISTAINGISSALFYDAAGRPTMETNALGVFSYTYDGGSFRRISEAYPNGLTAEMGYGDNLQDQSLHRITYKIGSLPLSESIYDRDAPAGRIKSWSQQSGTETPSVYAFDYDLGNELISALLSQGTNLVRTFNYGYDAVNNRIVE